MNTHEKGSSRHVKTPDVHPIAYRSSDVLKHLQDVVKYGSGRGSYMELTLKEYATSAGLSYEAVRQSFKTHAGELLEGEHYRMQGRTKVLTDAGIEKMNTYRKKPIDAPALSVSSLNVRVRELQDQIDKLTAERDTLKADNAELQLKIVELEQKITDRSEELISALFRLQSANEKLLTAAAEPKQEQKHGLFYRLFHKI